ncbi:hypothetical protein Zm00014a_040597 [Zea mays]|uniref:Uncharacterized protein n=1 Tax=Zea mays TaxID=4577 RepID=A0A3L6DRN7_MAIZE|nr:hypothetical protein Zm00014a_040597 [Zea mays]
MAEDANVRPPHSPRTAGIIQHFECQVRLHTDALNEDVQVTNERIDQLETTQIIANNTLTTLEQTLAATNTSLAAIITRLDRMEQFGREGRQQGDNDGNGSITSTTRDDDMEYSADTEHEDRSNRHRRHQ